MTLGDDGLPAFPNYMRTAPHNISIVTSASYSSASSSFSSEPSSQCSNDTTITIPTDQALKSLTLPPLRRAAVSQTESRIANAWSGCAAETTVPLELRQNPRRSSQRSGCPPPLVKQDQRKVNFVDNLVDSSTHLVEAIWPTSSVSCHVEHGSSSVLPLRTFIQETLRRSRTSYSTLQVALYYLILIRPHVPKYDFTMEQGHDLHDKRALQCGRRMFLAALILASKYLQDRNYSTRAWSKISGLNTKEINQNEMAVLEAIKWNLHITQEVYEKWADRVFKISPPSPPSPGSGVAQHRYEQQCEEFRRIVRALTPELELETEVASSIRVHPRSLYTPVSERTGIFASVFGNGAMPTPTSTPTALETPPFLEPTPATFVNTPGRLAPALGLLPTPRLTPHSSSFSTPAASATAGTPVFPRLPRCPSMGFALAQASSHNAAQFLDRWPAATMTSSPQNYHTRRSSLAYSTSTASSPESMVSDSSLTSRSSSISSASSLASAPSSKLDVQARCRYAKMCSERLSVRPTIASVPEDDYDESCLTSSPESYTGPSAKDLYAPLLEDAAARRQREETEAARALQQLRDQAQSSECPPPAMAGYKRRREPSVDLQENVREMLMVGHGDDGNVAWPNNLVCAPRGSAVSHRQAPAFNQTAGGYKRLRYSVEAI